MTEEEIEKTKKRLVVLRVLNLTVGLSFEELVEFQRLKLKLQKLNIKF
jgi:hypothetical protein